MLAVTAAWHKRGGGRVCVCECGWLLEFEGLGGHLVVVAAGGKKAKLGGREFHFYKESPV